MLLRYLTGNPCTDFQGYRDYVIATLPQLQVRFLIEKKNKLLNKFTNTNKTSGFIQKTGKYLPIMHKKFRLNLNPNQIRA